MTRHAHRTSIVGALLGAVLLSAGCGSDASAPTEAAGTERARPAPAALVKAGTAGEAIVRLWDYMRSGAVPSATLMYDEVVRRRTGVVALSGALANQQANLAGVVESVVDSQATRAGRLVFVQARRSDGTLLDVSYLMNRRGDRWYVLYDSLMATAIPEFVTTSEQAGINPAAKTPSARAASAGRAVATSFRTTLFDGAGQFKPVGASTRTARSESTSEADVPETGGP